jgi:membrane protease YdiL (CAAX protease family)
VALIALIVAVALTGTILTTSGAAVHAASRMVGYVEGVVVAWGLLAYVGYAARPRGTLRALIGRRWHTWRDAIRDVALALLGWAILEICELSWVALFHAQAPAAVAMMLPHGPVERAAWLVLSLSVGLSEELVFRGYLLTQLAGFTGSAAVANVLQALLFGLAHAEQGRGAMVRLAAYGLALGTLARWRRSLVPGILCHTWTNIASGILRA